MKHRYIFCGIVWKQPEICNYRLISKPTYSHGSFVRVNIPDDLELSHYSGDGYSITYVGDYRIMESNNNDIESPIEIVADNPIDACVDMIIKLHEQKLL